MTEERYLEYECIKAKFVDLQEQFAKVLLEKERLFTRTLPSAIRYDKDKVQTLHDMDKGAKHYVINMSSVELAITILLLGELEIFIAREQEELEEGDDT